MDRSPFQQEIPKPQNIHPHIALKCPQGLGGLKILLNRVPLSTPREGGPQASTRHLPDVRFRVRCFCFFFRELFGMHMPWMWLESVRCSCGSNLEETRHIGNDEGCFRGLSCLDCPTASHAYACCLDLKLTFKLWVYQNGRPSESSIPNNKSVGG